MSTISVIVLKAGCCGGTSATSPTAVTSAQSCSTATTEVVYTTWCAACPAVSLVDNNSTYCAIAAYTDAVANEQRTARAAQQLYGPQRQRLRPPCAYRAPVRQTNWISGRLGKARVGLGITNFHK